MALLSVTAQAAHRPSISAACELVCWTSPHAAGCLRVNPPVEGIVMTGASTQHVAIVTGANHGIGAATARALARTGCAVICTYLRLADTIDPGTPELYRRNRAMDADAVVSGIQSGGGDALALEENLRDPNAVVRLFDAAEAAFGP